MDTVAQMQLTRQRPLLKEQFPFCSDCIIAGFYLEKQLQFWGGSFSALTDCLY